VPHAASATLNNVNNFIGGAGTIGEPGFTLNNEKQGTVAATGNTLIIVGATVTNSGHIEANANTLAITGGATVTNAGLLEAVNSGDLFMIGDTIVNTVSGTIEAGSASQVDLLCTISGGTLETVGDGLIAGNTVTLEGVASNPLKNEGTFVDSGGGQLTLEGVIDNSGRIDIQSSGGPTVIDLQPTGSSTSVTLTGQGTIALNGSSPITFEAQSDLPITLINVNNTISGAGGIGAGSVGN
jgi:hypothetical protein